jgi:hypothetical protein
MAGKAVKTQAEIRQILADEIAVPRFDSRARIAQTFNLESEKATLAGVAFPIPR